MASKLFVLTAGTVAAGVAQEFQEQMRIRKENGLSELEVMVRSIDTADLGARGLLSGEWKKLSIDNQFMDGIKENPGEHYPELEDFLYPGHLPETTSDGGGGIRYNGAGAILLNRNDLQKWIKASMDDLAQMGGNDRNFSIALLVSAVGATGSGILERLTECVIGAVREVNPNEDPRCNIFILQPGTQKVTNLGLANTVALFAEMAANRLAGTNTTIRRYKGRTILVGWGNMHSIQQLQEASATLLRIIHDPITEIATEYRERAVDNQMLLDTDPHTHLPSHLSSATAITIGLGNLEEQMIQRDASRLLEGLALGNTTTASSEPVSVLQSAITTFLNGADGTSRYEHLLDRISEGIGLSCESITKQQMEKIPAKQRAARLEGDWQADKDLLTQQGRDLMQKQGKELAKKAVEDMLSGRRLGIGAGHSLKSIRNDYKQMQRLIQSVQRVAQAYTPPEADDDEMVRSKLRKLAKPGLFGGGRVLENAFASVQDNLRSQRLREANQVANQVLQAMAAHCVATSQDLDTIIHETTKRHTTTQNSSVGKLQWYVTTDHPLHMPALSKPEEIDSYYSKVSIFSSDSDDQKDAYLSSLLDDESEQAVDPLSDFRRQLEKQGKLDILFSGNFDWLFNAIQIYVRQKIHEHIKDHSVVDVLLQAGENVLYERLDEAANKAVSLVSFTPGLASSRREVWHVSVCCKDDRQRGIIEEIKKRTFRQGECTLLKSEDPTELVIFYYIDGLAMSAIKDLTGRCLKAFLEKRRAWYIQAKAAGKELYPDLDTLYRQSATVSVYRGKKTEGIVQRTRVIRRLYRFRENSLEFSYRNQDIPEFDPHHQALVDKDLTPLEETNASNEIPSPNGHQRQRTGELPNVP